jgi:hypothetical protein
MHGIYNVKRLFEGLLQMVQNPAMLPEDFEAYAGSEERLGGYHDVGF